MNYLSNIANMIEPYKPGEQLNDKKYIKLNTNENPYSPSLKIKKLLENYSYEELKLYPNPESNELKKTLSNYYNLSTDEIFIGNGSDEVLALSFLTFFNREDTILFPDITYSFYDVYANLYQIMYEQIPLNKNFEIEISNYNKEAKGIVIANPNAPTGIYLEKDVVKKLIEDNKDKLIIVDEAYIDFGGESCIDLISKNNNLLIIRTLSKSRSLAGIRVGFAIGNVELIKGLNKIKNSFNSYTINRLSEKIAIEAYKDEKYYKNCLSKIINTRENTKNEFIKLGFHVLESKTNFLFVKHDFAGAKSIFDRLKEKGILLRYFNKKRINNYLRISVGKENDMRTLVREMKKLI